MRRRERRPFAKHVLRGCTAIPAPQAFTQAKFVIGLDPGHDSPQVAALVAYWPGGETHVVRCVGTQHRSAETTIGLVNQGPWPPCLTIATERAARAVPAGHAMSLVRRLEAAGFEVSTYVGSAKGRIDHVECCLDPDHQAPALTVNPDAREMLDALARYTCKVTVKGALGWAPRHPAHWIDALSYALCYVAIETDPRKPPRSGGPREKSILTDSETP